MHPRTIRIPRARLIAASAAAAALAVAVVTAGSGTAADPFQAGQVSTRLQVLPAQARSAIETRALGHLRELGLQPGVRRSVERLEDRFAGMTYDEVTDIDSTGQPTTILQYDTAGSLRSAIALGWHGSKGRALPDPAAAARRGRDLARIVGAPAGDAKVESLLDGRGWRLSWPRFADGVAVPGDGLRMELWPDGSLHNLVRSERALAPRPASVIDELTAVGLVDGLLQTWYGTRRSELVIETAPLAWVAPNDAFAPAQPDAPASTLRLARVVAVRATGSVAREIERLEVYIDAGDGELLGGDVLE